MCGSVPQHGEVDRGAGQADVERDDTCAEAGTGTFSVVTQNGARLIKFAGQPKPVDAINYTVGYGEYAPNVMARYRINKPTGTHAVTQSQRLNGTAGDALRKAVGL